MNVPRRSLPLASPLSGRERYALVATLFGAAALRLADAVVRTTHPDRMRDFPDQMYSVALARMPWGEMIRTTAADAHPPLYYALLKVWFALTPDTLFWAEALSVLFAVASLWLAFRLGRDLFSRAAGWGALICAALAPYQIYWHHAPRNHLLQPVAVAAVVWLSYRFLAYPRRAVWCALAAAWALAIHTNYMGLIVGVVWGVAFLVAEPAPWRRKVALAASTAPGLLTFAWWLPTLLGQLDGGPMNHDFFQETVSPIYLYYHSLFGEMIRYQPNQSGLRFIVGLLVFTLVCVAGARAVGRRWSFWVLLLGLPTAPIVTARLAHWTLAERHLLFCLPVFMAYWGASLTAAWTWLRVRTRIEKT